MKIEYRDLRDGEEAAAAAVAEAAFVTFIAQSYSEQGAEEFRTYAHKDSIRARSDASTPSVHHAIVAEFEDESGHREIIGVAEIRDWNHLSMLFVHPDWHRKGIGNQLLQRLLAISRTKIDSLREITVKSSPFAVPIYERYGFHVTGDAEEHRGLIFIPMVLPLKKKMTDLVSGTKSVIFGIQPGVHRSLRERRRPLTDLVSGTKSDTSDSTRCATGEGSRGSAGPRRRCRTASSRRPEDSWGS